MHDSLLLRKNKLAARNELSPEERRDKSCLIEEKVFQIDEVSKGTTFFVYVSFRSEVTTFGIIEKLLSLKKTVTVPITHVKEKRIDAVRITRPHEELSPGYCDIPEPRKEIWETQKMDPKDIDIIFLPGSVFDERGGRFGYGGGYYDRFLASVPKAIRVGLAFELQMIERAPLQDHDEILDYVVTEKRIIKGMRNR